LHIHSYTRYAKLAIMGQSKGWERICWSCWSGCDSSSLYECSPHANEIIWYGGPIGSDWTHHLLEICLAIQTIEVADFVLFPWQRICISNDSNGDTQYHSFYIPRFVLRKLHGTQEALTAPRATCLSISKARRTSYLIRKPWNGNKVAKL
jgi:hypothetical protein